MANKKFNTKKNTDNKIDEFINKSQFVDKKEKPVEETIIETKKNEEPIAEEKKVEEPVLKGVEKEEPKPVKKTIEQLTADEYKIYQRTGNLPFA